MDKVLKIYKIGNFYNCYGDNGVLLHYLMGYKFVESRNSCSYPSSAYNDNIIDSYKGISNKYLEVMDKAKERYRIEQVIREYKLNNKNYKIEDLIDAINSL